MGQEHTSWAHSARRTEPRHLPLALRGFLLSPPKPRGVRLLLAAPAELRGSPQPAPPAPLPLGTESTGVPRAAAGSRPTPRDAALSGQSPVGTEPRGDAAPPPQRALPQPAAPAAVSMRLSRGSPAGGRRGGRGRRLLLLPQPPSEAENAAPPGAPLWGGRERRRRHLGAVPAFAEGSGAAPQRLCGDDGRREAPWHTVRHRGTVAT